MAKRNIGWISVIVIMLLIGFIWLSQTVQWRSYIAAVELENIPIENDFRTIDQTTSELTITSLLPPSETLASITQTISLQNEIDVSVQYLDNEIYNYEAYAQHILTEEMGDIHLIPNEWVLPLAVQGYFTPLDRLLTSEYIEEQTTALIDSMKWNSNLWAAPYQINPYIVVPHLSLNSQLLDVEQSQIKSSEVSTDNSAFNVVNAGSDTEPVAEVALTEENKEKLSKNILFSVLDSITLPHVIVNSDKNNVEKLFHFLNYIDQPGVHSGIELSEKQYNMLSKLSNQPELVTEHSIEDIAELKQPMPLFLVVSWSEFTRYSDFIETHYDLNKVEVPIYWTNGYSFVISNHTKHQQAAGQWIESLNRQQSNQHIMNIGMPVHQSNLSKLSKGWQSHIASDYFSPLDSTALMNVSIKWASQHEHINSFWEKDDVIQEKLAMWLNEAAPINLSQ